MTSRPSVMVLAAGNATRLRPLTDHLAKAVVPFLNRPLLDYTLDWLATEGFEQVVINLHHAGETIRDRFGDRAHGLRLLYSIEAELLGTAGGPRQALPWLGEDILLINGDVLARVDLGQLWRRHAEARAVATLGLCDGDQAAGFPCVLGSADGSLMGFPGDPAPATPVAITGVFTGIHLVQRWVIESVPAGEPSGIVTPVYRELLRAGERLLAVPVQGYWYEVGEPARYLAAQLDALRRDLLPLAVAGHERLGAGGWADPASHPAGTMVAPYLLGPRARVAPGARVEATVLGASAVVEADARLERVVLWEDAHVGARCDLRDVIVMSGVSVPEGTVAHGAVFAPGARVSFAARMERE